MEKKEIRLRHFVYALMLGIVCIFVFDPFDVMDFGAKDFDCNCTFEESQEASFELKNLARNFKVATIDSLRIHSERLVRSLQDQQYCLGAIGWSEFYYEYDLNPMTSLSVVRVLMLHKENYIDDMERDSLLEISGIYADVYIQSQDMYHEVRSIFGFSHFDTWGVLAMLYIVGLITFFFWSWLTMMFKSSYSLISSPLTTLMGLLVWPVTFWRLAKQKGRVRQTMLNPWSHFSDTENMLMQKAASLADEDFKEYLAKKGLVRRNFFTAMVITLMVCIPKLGEMKTAVMEVDQRASIGEWYHQYSSGDQFISYEIIISTAVEHDVQYPWIPFLEFILPKECRQVLFIYLRKYNPGYPPGIYVPPNF
jgi:hypothetical protein